MQGKGISSTYNPIHFLFYSRCCNPGRHTTEAMKLEKMDCFNSRFTYSVISHNILAHISRSKRNQRLKFGEMSVLELLKVTNGVDLD